MAEKLILDLNAQGKIPLIVGGTGLYIKALLENYDFATVDEKNDLRKELESFADEYGNEALHAKLAVLDKEEAERLHFNDRRRIIRAIETASHGEKVLRKEKLKLLMMLLFSDYECPEKNFMNALICALMLWYAKGF
jgi:tRNA dimethylallyltransferase